MYEDVKEQIAVAVIFQNGHALPRSFFWRGRKYAVESVNLEHREKKGSDPVFCFSVSSSGNSYELSFDSQHLVWTLERVWNE